MLAQAATQAPGGTSRTIDVAAVIDRVGLSPFNIRLILLSWLITVFDGFDMMMISFTAPYMRDELGLSMIMLGNIFSAGLVGMMIGGFLFAYLGDRFGRRPAIVSAAFLFGIFTLLTALAQSYHALLFLRFLDGVAIGGMLPLAWALNIEFVPTRMRATVVTLIMIGYSIGGSLAGPITVALAPRHGWEAVFVAGGLGTLVCAVALLIWLPESLRLLAAKGWRPDKVARTLNKMEPSLGAEAGDHFVLPDEAASHAAKGFRVSSLFAGRLALITPLLWIGYIASTLAIYFQSSWGPILIESLHFSRSTAAYVGSAGGIIGAIAGLSLMRVTDRFGPWGIVAFAGATVPILLIMGFTMIGGGAFLALLLAAAAGIGGGHFGILSIVGLYYPSAIRANGAGWATSIAKLGGIAGPILGAMALASGLSIRSTYASLAICPLILAVAATAIGLVLRATRRPA